MKRYSGYLVLFLAAFQVKNVLASDGTREQASPMSDQLINAYFDALHGGVSDFIKDSKQRNNLLKYNKIMQEVNAFKSFAGDRLPKNFYQEIEEKLHPYGLQLLVRCLDEFTSSDDNKIGLGKSLSPVPEAENGAKASTSNN